jgi:hypothetical protein
MVLGMSKTKDRTLQYRYWVEEKRTKHCYSRGTEQGKKGHTTVAEVLHDVQRERE